MMHIVTDKQSSVIVAVGRLKEYWPNGYPIITNTDGYDVVYPTTFAELHEVEEIPEGVTAHKYCYTPEVGFHENPNYEEPISDEERWVKQLMQEVSEYGY